MTLTGTRDLLCHLRVAPKWNWGLHICETQQSRLKRPRWLFWFDPIWGYSLLTIIVPRFLWGEGMVDMDKAVGLGDSRVSWHVTGREGIEMRVGWAGWGWGTGLTSRGQRGYASAYCTGPHLVFYWDRYAKDQYTEDLICCSIHRTAKGVQHKTSVPNWSRRISLSVTYIDYKTLRQLYITQTIYFLQPFTLFLALLFGSSSVDSDLPLIRFCRTNQPNVNPPVSLFSKISTCYTLPCSSQSLLQHCHKFLPSSVKAAGFCRRVNEILSFDTGPVVEIPEPSAVVLLCWL